MSYLFAFDNAKVRLYFGLYKIKVDNSEFTILGQFDRTAAGGQTEKNIPGYKVYDFKLPDALLNRDNICIRLRPVRLPAGVSSFMPLRLANISIKYNK